MRTRDMTRVWCKHKDQIRSPGLSIVYCPAVISALAKTGVSRAKLVSNTCMHIYPHSQKHAYGTHAQRIQNNENPCIIQFCVRADVGEVPSTVCDQTVLIFRMWGGCVSLFLFLQDNFAVLPFLCVGATLCVHTGCLEAASLASTY